MSIKRGHAINGDRFTIEHDTLSLAAPFTSFIDLAFRGSTHQVLSAANLGAFDFATTTAEFTVCGLQGYIVESLDNVETQVTHRYQIIVEAPTGVLSTASYESVEAALSLVGALRPVATQLGIVLDPNDDIEYTTAPKVAIQLDIGVVEVTPLTAEVIDQLPEWEGTNVAGGDLYAGRFTDDAPYLTLVTPTCRVLSLPGAGQTADACTLVMAELRANWQT